MPKAKKKPAEFRMIDHADVNLHDPVRERWDDENATKSGVRLYCTQSARVHGKKNARWNLQVFAWVKTKSGARGKHFGSGTASVSREDLEWLRQLIDAELGSDE